MYTCFLFPGRQIEHWGQKNLPIPSCPGKLISLAYRFSHILRGIAGSSPGQSYLLSCPSCLPCQDKHLCTFFLLLHLMWSVGPFAKLALLRITFELRFCPVLKGLSRFYLPAYGNQPVHNIRIHC